MTASPIEVHFDGRIFEKQSHGGISRVFYSLFRELAQINDLRLILHLNEGVNIGALPEDMEVRTLRDRPSIRPARLFKALNKRLGLVLEKRHFEQIGEGIFHSTYYSTCPAPEAKQVLTLHDLIFEDHPEYFQNLPNYKRHVFEKKRCIEEADAIVCVSQATRERLDFHFPGIEHKKPVEVIHNGFDLPRSTPCDTPGSFPAIDECKPYLLHVGSRHPHKNFDRLVMAVTRLSRRDLNLLTVGGGVWTDRERALIDELGLQGRARLIESASDDQLLAAYLNSAAVVVPSITEGFGLPLIEAMALGCMVACSSGGSLPEVGGDVPRYFDPHSVDEMVNAIEDTLSDSGDKGRLRLGRERAAAFTWRRCAARYAEMYRKISTRALAC